jgi:predicted permease
MPSWQSIKNPQMILASNELTTEFFLCALLALLNAHLAELYRTPQRFCLQLCFSTALPPEVFNNLKGLPLN